ncbi:MAG: DUF1232 domain-containing protein [Micrococcales bacterium]|nr:DUF1232 domain-containing protein [Micrococcales bacterium]
MRRLSRIKVVATAASVVRASTRPGAPGLVERAHAVPRLVRATLTGTYVGITRRRLGMVAAAVVYVASPLDLLPEAFLPIIGLTDDAIVISWALRVFIEETDRFLAWEQGQGIRPVAPTGWEARVGMRAGTQSAISVDSEAVTTGSPGRLETGAAATSRRVSTSARAAAGSATGAVREATTTYVLESVRKRLER